ncbi:MAG: hypothetical protein ACFFHV_13535 [Promethearchaeota archaeon]
MEFQGYQHFIFPNIYHSNINEFLYDIFTDEIKVEIAKLSNIHLIIFPYFIDIKMNNPIEIQQAIIDQLEELLNINISNSIPQFNHLEDYNYYHFE